jgi:hypothetical protein
MEKPKINYKLHLLSILSIFILDTIIYTVLVYFNAVPEIRQVPYKSGYYINDFHMWGGKRGGGFIGQFFGLHMLLYVLLYLLLEYILITRKKVKEEENLPEK